MIFSRDLSGYSVAVIVEMPLDAATFVNGAMLQAQTTDDQLECLPTTVTHTNSIGLYVDVGQTTTGTVALGTNTYGKVVVNPQGVFMAEYENSTTRCGTATFATKTWTVTHEQGAGDWIYHVDSLAAAGLLMYVAVSTGTTALVSVLAPTAATPPASANKLMYIHGPLTGIGSGSTHELDLTTDATMILTDTTLSGVGFVVLASYYSGRSGGLEQLRKSTHDNTVDTKARFFSELVIVDHVLVSI